MTLIKKRDVKEYFAARRLQAGQSPLNSIGKGGAPAPSQKDPVPGESNSPSFTKDFVGDHSSTKKGVVSPVDSNVPTASQPPLPLDRSRQ